MNKRKHRERLALKQMPAYVDDEEGDNDDEVFDDEHNPWEGGTCVRIDADSNKDDQRT